MRKKEMIAMLLAGGQGSRLGVLTATEAKPGVLFGGKYRIIDFPMSNCINSGVDTVGVLTQYQPLKLNQHIGIGIPWDLDRRSGGVTILSPHMKSEHGAWYTGTANAIYQNIEYIEQYNPDYVLVLGGDHIYKMDYSKMLDFHKRNKADVTIAALEVPWEEASRFGLMNVHADQRIHEFEEKPPNPKSNLANMGIYIFNWDVLRDALERDNLVHPDSDFGMHVLPMLLADGMRMFAYPFSDYWRDVGTIESYWEANMDLIRTVPEFNLYEEFNKIYTDADYQPPIFTGPRAVIQGTILSEGCEVLGQVTGSVLGPRVIVEEGASVKDSIILENGYIGKNSVLERCIVDINCTVGDGVVIGCGGGGNIPNELRPKIYNTGITVLGENSIVPDGVRIGQNCVIHGETLPADYPDKLLSSGKSILREQKNNEKGAKA
ncbi:MAG: glucose-1-phosphate adenylyltransferase [Defluviitaleaceae bacterium]|nr:glucose-1-phosphate adenylyltransferase [Defluviitaleaceae bacterium]MCL2239608.1 glucose-1-phosphate adenylyltransferase [Defluviitaleaceae bacterium]